MTDRELVETMKRTATIPGGNRRTIYEAGDSAGKGNGRYFMSYAIFNGSAEEIPRQQIDRMEAMGILTRAYPDAPHLNAWVLSSRQS